jgi:hypothetical protein
MQVTRTRRRLAQLGVTYRIVGGSGNPLYWQSRRAGVKEVQLLREVELLKLTCQRQAERVFAEHHAQSAHRGFILLELTIQVSLGALLLGILEHLLCQTSLNNLAQV